MPAEDARDAQEEHSRACDAASSAIGRNCTVQLLKNAAHVAYGCEELGS
jgi:hypothetical protein